VDANRKQIAVAEAAIAKIKKGREWRQQAQWLYNHRHRDEGQDYPAEVRAEVERRQKKFRDDNFFDYYCSYCAWECYTAAYEDAVKDLHKFEVANGLGEHQLHLNDLTTWRLLF